jgi:hypothetical protein
MTERGEKLVFRAHMVVEAVEERMLRGLSWDDRRRLLDALRSCTESLEAGTQSRTGVPAS